MLKIKSGKREIIEGIELPNQERMRMLEKRKTTINREYWKRTQSNKRRRKKKYPRRTRKLLETKLNSSDLIKEVNTWTVPTVVRYSRPFLKRDELRQMDQRSRKLISMNKALHPRIDISRKRGKDSPALKDCVDA